MPRAIRDMEKDAAAMVARMQTAVSVSAGKLSDFTAGGNCGAVTRGHTINGIY